MPSVTPLGAVINSADETTLTISAGVISVKTSGVGDTQVASGISASKVNGWTQLATQTITSGASFTFSSIPAYKRYMVACDNLTISSQGDVNIQFNATGTYANIRMWISGSDNGGITTGVGGVQYSTNASRFFMVCENNCVTGITYNTGSSTATGMTQYYIVGSCNVTAQITSIVVNAPSRTFTAGVWYLFGMN